MGIFVNKPPCGVCGGKIGLLGGYAALDGSFCGKCYDKITLGYPHSAWELASLDELKNEIGKIRLDRNHCGLCGKELPSLNRCFVENGCICESCFQEVQVCYKPEVWAEDGDEVIYTEAEDPIEGATLQELRESKGLQPEWPVYDEPEKSEYNVFLTLVRQGRKLQVLRVLTQFLGEDVPGEFEFPIALPLELAANMPAAKAKELKNQVWDAGGMIRLL